MNDLFKCMKEFIEKATGNERVQPSTENENGAKRKYACTSFSLKKDDQKLMIIHFSHPTNINISFSEKLWGRSLTYRSHIKETSDQMKIPNVAFS